MYRERVVLIPNYCQFQFSVAYLDVICCFFNPNSILIAWDGHSNKKKGKDYTHQIIDLKEIQFVDL